MGRKTERGEKEREREHDRAHERGTVREKEERSVVVSSKRVGKRDIKKIKQLDWRG